MHRMDVTPPTVSLSFPETSLFLLPWRRPRRGGPWTDFSFLRHSRCIRGDHASGPSPSLFVPASLHLSCCMAARRRVCRHFPFSGRTGEDDDRREGCFPPRVHRQAATKAVFMAFGININVKEKVPCLVCP